MLKVRHAIGCAIVALITGVTALFMDYYKNLNEETLIRSEAVNARDLIVHDLQLRMQAVSRLANRLAEFPEVTEALFVKEAETYLENVPGFYFVGWLNAEDVFEFVSAGAELPFMGQRVDAIDPARFKLLRASKETGLVEFSKPMQAADGSSQGFSVAQSVQRNGTQIGTIWVELKAADWIENLHFSGGGHMMHDVLLEVSLNGRPFYTSDGFQSSTATAVAAPKKGMKGHDAVTVRVKETPAYHEQIHNPLGGAVVAFVAILATTAVVAVFALQNSRRLERRAAAANETLTQTNERMHEEVKQRRIAEQDAKRSSIAKSQFLSTMSHEIRTPMNGIQGMSELLRESGLNERQKSYVTGIEKSSAALMTLICDILDFSKFEHGEIELKPEPCNINDLLLETVELLRPVAEKSGLQLAVNVESGAAARCLVDRMRLRQIILNLTRNALKFTMTGSVDVSLSSDDAGTVIKVRDTGIGISSSQLGTIFDSFAQVDGDTSRAFEGSGLGLSIVDRVVKAMDGTISVTSELGHGSEFVVTLPLRLAQAGVETMAQEDDAAFRALRAARILLAEDNGINQRIVKSFLKDQISALEVANDGDEAVERFRNGAYDLVLMDVSMPRKNGFDATRSIRKMQDTMPEKNCPIIAYTANVGDEDQRKCFDAGMDDVLAKPASKGEMLARLAYWMRAPRQGRA